MSYQSVMETMFNCTIGQDPMSNHPSFWHDYQKVLFKSTAHSDERCDLEQSLWRRYFAEDFPGLPQPARIASVHHERDEMIRSWERKRSRPLSLTPEPEVGTARGEPETIDLKNDDGTSWLLKNDQANSEKPVSEFYTKTSTGELVRKWELAVASKPWELTGYTTVESSQPIFTKTPTNTPRCSVSVDPNQRTCSVPTTPNTPPSSGRNRKRSLRSTLFSSIQKRRRLETSLLEISMPATCEGKSDTLASLLPTPPIQNNNQILFSKPPTQNKIQILLGKPPSLFDTYVRNANSPASHDTETFNTMADLAMNLDDPWNLGVDDGPLMRDYAGSMRAQMASEGVPFEPSCITQSEHDASSESVWSIIERIRVREKEWESDW